MILFDEAVTLSKNPYKFRFQYHTWYPSQMFVSFVHEIIDEVRPLGKAWHSFQSFGNMSAICCEGWGFGTYPSLSLKIAAMI